MIAPPRDNTMNSDASRTGRRDAIDRSSLGSTPLQVDYRIWRQGPEGCSDTDAHVLADGLSRLAILHEDRWPEAVSDPSVAIGIAMRNLLPTEHGQVGLLDIVMGPVLLHSRKGQQACALVLEHVRTWAGTR